MCLPPVLSAECEPLLGEALPHTPAYVAVIRSGRTEGTKEGSKVDNTGWGGHSVADFNLQESEIGGEKGIRILLSHSEFWVGGKDHRASNCPGRVGGEMGSVSMRGTQRGELEMSEGLQGKQ